KDAETSARKDAETSAETTDPIMTEPAMTDPAMIDGAKADGAMTDKAMTDGAVTDNAMTRSEERMHVSTERVASGRARLRKYVVTEDEEQTVPVRHEEVRITREPITDANIDAALDGPAISEAQHEVTLHEERPVTRMETVPVERVRLETEEVTEQRTVHGQVRKERIEAETDLDPDR
ncbi:MAG: YsnF/AvaK domain-containing protein, partial [Catenulispora sp.]|nr:YsnF/AvaK domain-containing protein [Catenulispora sp.]